MRKLIALMIISLFFDCSFLAFPGTASGEARAVGYSLSNSDANIGLNVDSTGYFSVGTMSGQKLTYKYPTAWGGTYLSVEIDGTVYDAGSGEGIDLAQYLQSCQALNDDEGLTVWDIGGITVSQRMVLHSVAGHFDEGYISMGIEVANHRSQGSRVRVRYHIDTQIDANDGAPFYVPGHGLVTAETQFNSGEIDFNYFQDFDNYEHPTLIGKFTLDGRSRPYRIILGYWPDTNKNAWEYTITPDLCLTGDSAALFYYDLGTLSPAGTGSSMLSYGIGYMGATSGQYAFKVDQVTTGRDTYAVNEAMSFSVDIGNSYQSPRTGTLRVEVYEPSTSTPIFHAARMVSLDSGTLYSPAFRTERFDTSAGDVTGIYTISATLSDAGDGTNTVFTMFKVVPYIISVTRNPMDVRDDEPVTFTVSVNGENVDRVNLYIDNVLVRSWNDAGTFNYKVDLFGSGFHSYYAEVKFTSGMAPARDPARGSYEFSVSGLRLYGNQHGNSDNVGPSKRYSRGAILSEDNSAAYAQYDFTLPLSLPDTLALQVRYTDLGWFSNGPTLYLWNWGSSRWDILFANAGKGTDNICSVGFMRKDYVSADQLLKVKVENDWLDATDIDYVQISEPWYSIVYIPMNWGRSLDDFRNEARAQANLLLDSVDVLTLENSAIVMADSVLTLEFDKTYSGLVNDGFSKFSDIKRWANRNGMYGSRYVALTDENIWDDVVGLSDWGDTVVCERGWAVVSAHEIGHSYGLLDEYRYTGISGWLEEKNSKYPDRDAPGDYPLGYPNPYPNEDHSDSGGRRYGDRMICVMGLASPSENRGYCTDYCKPWMDDAIPDKSSRSLYSPSSATVVVEFYPDGRASIIEAAADAGGAWTYPDDARAGEFDIRLGTLNGTAINAVKCTPRFMLSPSTTKSDLSGSINCSSTRMAVNFPTGALTIPGMDQSLVVEVVNSTTNATIARSTLMRGGVPANDVTTPVLTVLSPRNGEAVNSESFTVRGQASDGDRVARVELSRDGREWTPCEGTTSWSATLSLPEGKNTLYLRATDSSGNTQTASVTIDARAPPPAANASMSYLPLLIILTVLVVGVSAAAAAYSRRGRKPAPLAKEERRPASRQKGDNVRIPPQVPPVQQGMSRPGQGPPYGRPALHPQLLLVCPYCRSTNWIPEGTGGPVQCPFCRNLVPTPSQSLATPGVQQLFLVLPNGRRLPVRGNAVLGRADFNDCLPPELAMDISRRHFEISLENMGFWLRDGGDGTPSTNGTYLDGARLPPSTQVPLRDGARIRVGNVLELMVRMETR